MRLNQIKLSGFKSFAEPTTFQLPGQRVGVVGPNGCGKSNIMDAVRWVLGESKASELRGESMQDVIFNGSGNRKPASRASVELVFSNEDARAGGQWNQFAEIAVKRVLTRDGTSSYYINNQPVRRRDVQDVFLGTGLGPRAYAIIGQGTISRIIESQARGTAHVPRRGRRRLEVQGAPPRDREPAQGHAREPHAGGRHPARAQRQPRQAREAGRGGAAIPRLQHEGHTQAAPAVVPQAPRCGQRARAGQAWPCSKPPTRWSRAWPSCATSRRSSRAMRQAHYVASDALHTRARCCWPKRRSR
jgi:energy-coupling factor transporter ATP-binding protein EcfA2